MRIVHSLANSVKISTGPKRVFFLALIAVGVAAAALLTSRFIVQRSSARSIDAAKSKQQGCCRNVPATQRRMVGTYYTTEDNFKSTLVLNNKGPNQIVVTPILHSQNGQTFNGPPVAVGGQSSYEADLNAVAARAGREFRSGSFEFTYTGRLLEMGGGLRIVDSEKSLIFDEQMLEPGMKFSSSQLEAVYALPFDSARVSVIVTNTTSQLLAVQGEAAFAGSIVRFPIIGILKPHETSVIDLPPGLVKKASAGAVSINHNGPKGALLAMIHVQDPDRGYSESVNFSDPAQGKTNQLHGAGLRLGSVNGDSLSPVIVVRNIAKNATAVAANVPYSKQDGKTGKISLPQLSLAPGEIKLFDTSNPQLKQKDFATAGLEIEYKGAPGSVIATASSSTYLHAEWSESEVRYDETLICVTTAVAAACAVFCEVQSPDFTVAHDKSSTGLKPTGIIAGVNGADPPITAAETQATVTVSTNPPTSGLNVTLSVVAREETEFDAGGHVNHTGVRPVGTLSQSSGTTNQNGVFTAVSTHSRRH